MSNTFVPSRSRMAPTHRSATTAHLAATVLWFVVFFGFLIGGALLALVAKKPEGWALTATAASLVPLLLSRLRL